MRMDGGFGGGGGAGGDSDAGESGGSDSARPAHPIGVVARRTGLTLHVLRAWERRYKVVTPTRAPGGKRLYTDDDVARLRLLRQATEAGRTISSVARLSIAELSHLIEGDSARAVNGDGVHSPGQHVMAVVEAGLRMDGDAAYGILMRALVSLRPMEFYEKVLMPVLHEVGDRWHLGKLGAAQEHVVSVATRRALTWLLQAYDVPNGGPMLVASTVAGELHEFGAMATSAVALEEGWRVTYLGPSLPAEELSRAAVQRGARVVALSVVVSDPAPETAVQEVARMRSLLPVGCLLIVGGAGAQAMRRAFEEKGAVVVSSLDGLRSLLRSQLV